MYDVLRNCGKQYLKAFSMKNHFLRSAVWTTAAKFFVSPGGVLPSIPSIDTPLEPQWKAQASPRWLYYTYIELFLSYKRLFTSTPRRRKIGWSSSACDGGRPYKATTQCDTFLESPCNAQHFILWQWGTYRYSDTRYSDTRYSDTRYSDTCACCAF